MDLDPQRRRTTRHRARTGGPSQRATGDADRRSRPATAATTAHRTAARPGPTDRPGHPGVARQPEARKLLASRRCARSSRQAKDAGAQIISTSASFKAIKPTETVAYRFDNLDRVVDIAREAGLDVKLRMTWTPTWALDEAPVGARQAPRSDAELARWEKFVRDVMRHVDGKVGYVEVWTEPNSLSATGRPARTRSSSPACSTSARAPSTSVAPDTKVIAGGLRGNDVGYLDGAVRRLRRRSGSSSTPFDMLGVEPFNGGAAPEAYDEGQIYQVDPFGEVDGNFLGFESLRDVMVEHGDEDRADLHHAVRLLHERQQGQPGRGRRHPRART